MYGKNLLINKQFNDDENVSQIEDEIPYLYSIYDKYKIESIYVVFKDIKQLRKEANGTALKVRKNGEDNYYDILNDEWTIIPISNPKICYAVGDKDNNSVILNANIHFNMICSGIVKHNVFIGESDWFKKTSKINIRFCNENFKKLIISEYYLNIKLQDDQPNFDGQEYK